MTPRTSTDSQPVRISAIITAYNEEAFLSEAIDSVLSQERRPDEIIVVDDGSTDGTAKIIDAYASRLPHLLRSITLPLNKGVPYARNVGAWCASSDTLAFLDGDDQWLPNKLRIQSAILSEHPETAFTYGTAIEFGDGWSKEVPECLGSSTGVYDPPDLCVGYLNDRFWNFWPSGLLIRQNAFVDSGGFIHDLARYQHWEDFFYACSLALRYSAVVLDQPLTYYRVHEASCSQRAHTSKKTIVDERAGLDWFVRHLSTTFPHPPTGLRAVLVERLERNARRYWEAYPQYPELAASAQRFESDGLSHAIENVHAVWFNRRAAYE